MIKRLLFAGTLSLLAASCNRAPVEPGPATPQPVANLGLEDSIWVLEAIETPESTLTVERTDYRFRFVPENKRLWGQLACNSGDGAFTSTDSLVRIPAFAQTKAGCFNDPYSALLLDYFNGNDSLFYEITGRTLRLRGEGMTLRFSASPFAVGQSPALNLSCGEGPANLCTFDYNVDSSTLASATRTRIETRRNSPYTMNVSLVRLRPGSLSRASMIFNLPDGSLVAGHTIQITPSGTWGSSSEMRSGILEGYFSGSLRFFLHEDGSVAGDFRFDGKMYEVTHLENDVYLLIQVDLSRIPMED
jgi:heat shock protein HslJ